MLLGLNLLGLFLVCDSASKWQSISPHIMDNVNLLTLLWKPNTKFPHLIVNLSGLLKTQQGSRVASVVSMPAELTRLHQEHSSDVANRTCGFRETPMGDCAKCVGVGMRSAK